MKITVRTLDSTSHEFILENDELTVKEFKEHIQPKVNIPVEIQRLIFRGKVLQDDKKIKEYGVDGCVVHLVQRAPPSTISGQSSTTSTSQSQSGVSEPLPFHAQNLVDSLISQFGAGNVSMNSTGNSLNLNVNVSNFNTNNDVRERIETARRFFSHAQHLLVHLQPPPQRGPAGHFHHRPSQPHRCTRHQAPAGASATTGCRVHTPNNQPRDAPVASSEASTDPNEVTMEDITDGETDPVSAETPASNVETSETTPNASETTPNASETTTTTSETTPTATSDGQQATPQQQPAGVSAHVYSHLIGDFMHLFHHLAPYIQRYRALLHDPPPSGLPAHEDSLPDTMAEIFHDLSHAFHAMSDLSYNFTQPSQYLSCFPHISPLTFPSGGINAATGQQSRGNNPPAQQVRMTAAPRGTNPATLFAPRANGQRPQVVAAISTTVLHLPDGTVLPAGNPTAAFSRPPTTSHQLGQPQQPPVGGQFMMGPFTVPSTSTANTSNNGGGAALGQNMQDMMQSVMASILGGGGGAPRPQPSVAPRPQPSVAPQQPQQPASTGPRSVLRANNHPDPLLPCRSFHNGPTFQSTQTDDSGEQPTSQTVEFEASLIMGPDDAPSHTSYNDAPTNAPSSNTSTPAAASSFASSPFMRDLMNLFQSLFTLQDLLSLGGNVPWGRLQTPLRDLVAKHYNSNLPITNESFPGIIERMHQAPQVADMNLTIRPDVDLEATLSRLETRFLQDLLKLLLLPEAEFVREVQDDSMMHTDQLISVLDYAVTGGADEYFRNYDFSQILSTRQLLSLLRLSTTPLTPAALEEVIVRPSSPKLSVQRKNPCKQGDNSGSAAKRVRRDEPVDVKEAWEQLNAGGSEEATVDSDLDGEHPPSPEDWNSLVPNDWIKVISRDAERQRVIAPQRPYSDAYLNGLPAKRRSLLTRHSAEADRIDLKSSLNSAVKKAGAEKRENLNNDVESAELQAMFEATFREDIERRLREDDDFRPGRHPNAEKYFKGKK